MININNNLENVKIEYINNECYRGYIVSAVVDENGNFIPPELHNEKDEKQKLIFSSWGNKDAAINFLESAINQWLDERKKINARKQKEKARLEKEAEKLKKSLMPIFEALKKDYNNLPESKKASKLLLIDEARATGHRGGAIVDKDQIFNFDAFHLKLSAKETEFLNNLTPGNICILPKELADPTSYKNFITYIMIPE